MRQLERVSAEGGWHWVKPVDIVSLDWKLFWIMRVYILQDAISVPSQL